MPFDRWTLTLAGLLGEPWPMPPELPGVVHTARDAPLTADELAGITSPTELALCAGISRQAAHQRLQRQAETAGASISPAPEPTPTVNNRQQKPRRLGVRVRAREAAGIDTEGTP